MESITKAEFNQASIAARGGKGPSPEGAAFRALAPGAGLKMPCRWNHTSKGTCAGGVLARSTAKYHGFQVTTRCKDKVLYVWRLT